MHSIDEGVIAEIAPIPKIDLPAASLQFLPHLDETTRDCLLASYENADVILCTDDPALSRFAAGLGIRCVTSYQVIHRSVVFDEDVASLDAMDSIYLIAKGPIKPNSLTGALLLNLGLGNCSLEECRDKLSVFGIRFSADSENIKFLIDIYIIWVLNSDKFPMLEKVITLFAELFETNNLSARQWLKDIVGTAGRPSNDQSALVLLKVYSLFFKLDFFGPLSHKGWFHELGRNLNV